MRQSHSEELFLLFRQFAEEFIINRNSFISDTQAILSSTAIGNCLQNYVDNFQAGKASFGDKVDDQFKNADLNTRLVFAHADWLWSFAVNDISPGRKRESAKRIIRDDNVILKNVFPGGFGHAGMYHKNNKYEEVKFNLGLIRLLSEEGDKGNIKTVDDVINWTEKACLYQNYDQEFEKFPMPESFDNMLPKRKVAMCNILCFVAKPDIYERIASNGHKWQIYTSFSGLLTKEERENDAENIDQKIHLIRNKIGELIHDPNFDFYDEQDVARIWNYSINEEGYEIVQGLQYKKAVVLYGPPGTSKTHSAKNLANALLRISFLSKKDNILKYFKETEDFIANRIHHLQLHSNYNYEDFVGGLFLEEHSTEIREGKLFTICRAAEEDKKNQMPHVLILDEINRVDLSRLFGEVFSALENREQEIEIGVGNLKLKIPDNLYVIGTMNEIDFSLERMDFALRRRFLWFFYGFNADTLRNIIRHKNDKLSTHLNDDEVELFIKNAAKLNEAITALPELGEQYQIGHTFLGEVVDIFHNYKALNGYVNRMKNQIFRNEGPAKILWNISIKPMLLAFLGNMDRETKNNTLQDLFKIYLP